MVLLRGDYINQFKTSILQLSGVYIFIRLLFIYLVVVIGSVILGDSIRSESHRSSENSNKKKKEPTKSCEPIVIDLENEGGSSGTSESR